MSISSLLAPRTIAVVGASETAGKVGSTVIQNLLQAGFQGDVFPVNPKYSSVHGLIAYAGIEQLPQVPELVVICTPAATVPALVHQCGRLGVPAMLILSAGFREIGAEGKIVEDATVEALSCYPGMRIIGPNCLGILSPWTQMSASFAIGMPKPGSVALLSQSGALCTAILDWALSKGIGFSHFISLGNQLDVGFADLLDYLANDPHTSSAILYIESITKADYFIEAASRFASCKPLIAYKAGRFAESAQAATSHTGAMAGVDAVYQAVFDRVGIVRVYDLQSMFECAELLARHPRPVGERLAIVTNAGGPGVMATDALLASHGKLARLSPDTIQQLSHCLPSSWSHNNPVDVLGDSDPERFAKAVEIVSSDENVDTLLALLTPQAMTQPETTARWLARVARTSDKTFLAAWMGGQQMASGKALLQAAQIPTYDTAEQAIGGFQHLVAYARARLANAEFAQPKLQNEDEPSRRPASSVGSQRNDQHAVLLSSVASKALLQRYSIPVAAATPAATVDQAIEVAQQIGYPVVLKILSPQITHKTEVNGVALNIQNSSDVRRQFEQMVEEATRLRPDACIEGVTVEPMIAITSSVELIVGMKSDPLFGPVIMVGYGGIASELFQDRALELPKVCKRLALRMLQRLRCWPLLSGYRNRPAVDLEKLSSAIANFAELVRLEPNLVEADINPLLAGPRQVVALDARFVIRNGHV